MELYTSYYGKLRALKAKGIVPIGISLWTPKFFYGQTVKDLAPRKYMLDDSLSEEEYTKMYKEKVLKGIDVKYLLNKIGQIAQGRPAALLCYEKSGDFCHRRIVAEWLKEKTGYEVKEFEYIKKEGPILVQASLF